MTVKAKIALATVVLAGIAVVGAVALARGDGDSSPAKVTRAQANGLLDDFFKLAQARDGQAFCADERVYSNEMCEFDWEKAGGPDAVPPSAPRVLRTRSEEDLLALRVCGTDGVGRPYQADFVVERRASSLTVPLPVFWAGRTYSRTYKEGEAPPLAQPRPSSPEPAGCD